LESYWDCIWISDVNKGCQDLAVTKREVLRYAAKIYDPLGFIVPITFHGKVFLQSLWKHNFTWDEQLPKALCQEFYKLFKLLQEASTIKIPRLLEPLIMIQFFQVLVFCDASTRYYGATVYMNTSLSEDTKNPKLLPRHEWFTVLLVREVHQRLVHTGVAHTLVQLREKYWITQG